MKEEVLDIVKRNLYKNSVWKPEENRPLGRHKIIRKDIIKVNFTEKSVWGYALDSSDFGQSPLAGWKKVMKLEVP
jgi:hypothetical protein